MSAAFSAASFRFWAEFDYCSQSVDVRGVGCFPDKPLLDGQAKSFKRDDDEQHDGQQEEEDVGEEDGVEGDDGDDGQRMRRARRRAVVGEDRPTLVIADPCDASNFVICHHKALRNMILAFVHACVVLDPLSPPPRPCYEVQAVAWFSEAELNPVGSVAPSSAASSATTSAVASTASTAPPTPTMSGSPSATASAVVTPGSTAATSARHHAFPA